MNNRTQMSEEAKAARRAYKRKWAAANRERIREYKRAWDKNNKDKVEAAQARYWEKKAQAEKDQESSTEQ